MKVLVTGNKGYIGSVLCQELLNQGFEAIGLDTGFYDGCSFLKPDYGIKQISKDIRKVTKEDILGVDAIVHLAALSNDPIGALNPRLTHEINCRASVRLAKLAKESKIERFIFSSSCSIYGIAGEKMINENGTLAPATEYARSKAESERQISKLASRIFSPVFLRNATIYGVSPMMRVDLVANNLVGWAYTTKKIRVMSDGTPWRPLIHIQDACKAFIAVLKAPRELIHNQTFNVGQNSENYRVRDIVGMIKKIMPECNIEYTGEHGPDSRTYKVDFSKFSKSLEGHFKPIWNIEKGVKELLAAYKNRNFTEEDFLSDKFTRLKRIKALLNEGKIDEYLYWKKPVLAAGREIK